VEGSNHYLFPDKDPSDKPASRAKLFDIKVYNKNRRTASSRTEAVDIIKAARLQNRSKTCVERLMRDSGYKGYSLMACPSPADRAAYTHMSYLWDIGPSSAPYDVMHLVLQNNVSTVASVFRRVERLRQGSTQVGYDGYPRRGRRCRDCGGPSDFAPVSSPWAAKCQDSLQVVQGC